MEKRLSGKIDVELNALAYVRQRWEITLPYPMTIEEAEQYASEQAGNHVWNYQGVQAGTIDATVWSVEEP